MTFTLGLLGAPNPSDQRRGHYGGLLPSLRTTYPLHVREALNALAESNPTPERFAREQAHILNYHPEQSAEPRRT